MDEGITTCMYEWYTATYSLYKKKEFCVKKCEEQLRILNAMITAANTQPDKIVRIGDESIEAWVMREADEVQEALVYRHKSNETLIRLIDMLNETVPEYIDRINDVRNKRLRTLYQRNGLHGMYAVAQPITVVNTDPVCLLCCDQPPTQNVAKSCEHEIILCHECTKKLARCPVCMNFADNGSQLERADCGETTDTRS